MGFNMRLTPTTETYNTLWVRGILMLGSDAGLIFRQTMTLFILYHLYMKNVKADPLS